jgi:hypothetical protein
VQVTVYDRHDRAGGLMTYGIPGFKLEKPVVHQRIRQLEDGGVQFVLDCNVGEDISFAAIRGQHDAVMIATGVYRARELTGPGADLPGIVRALDYLTASNRKGFGDEVPDYDSGELNAEGKRVVVIGGGDTAMDCVRTAIRQGATSVKCLYRRDRANMPGSQREVAHAEEEGVEFVWLSTPDGLRGRGRGERRAGAEDAPRRARPDRPASARADPRRRGDRARRPGDQGAGIRARGPADALGREGAAGDALGHGAHPARHARDRDAGRLCGGRHRARREPCRLGDPRRREAADAILAELAETPAVAAE